MIKMKKREILVNFVKAVENVPEGVQFDADAISLIKNKNALKTEYEALQLQNRPVPTRVCMEYHITLKKYR